MDQHLELEYLELLLLFRIQRDQLTNHIRWQMKNQFSVNHLTKNQLLARIFVFDLSTKSKKNELQKINQILVLQKIQQHIE